TTMVYPILLQGKPLGVIIFSLIKDEQEVSQEEKDLLASFTDVVGVAIQNSRLYSDLANANERLKELDHLKDEFLAYASHEIRTPLTSIRGYADLLLKQTDAVGKLTEKPYKFAQIIYTSSERLIKLVINMLDVSLVQAGRFEITTQAVDPIHLV